VNTTRAYRTVWISDVHLGSRDCKAEYLFEFLASTQCEYLFLVGDIIDVWALKKNVFWPQAHNNVLRAILGKAKHGTRVIYVPGNHDEIFKDHSGNRFGNVQIEREYIHTTVAGKKLLVIHGDEFDSLVTCSWFESLIGNIGYDLLLASNRWYHHIRCRFGYPYWSLASFIKRKLKNAMQHVQRYENIVAHETLRHEADGVVCGHIHHPHIRQIDGVQYHNDGDWVEHCSALVESQDGDISLVYWSDLKNRQPSSFFSDGHKAA
jgi:UDP-2,3-diacylglucosamine pyrophosphatase LpxH